MKYVRIQCSNCGKSQQIEKKAESAHSAVFDDGWRSIGSAKYCRECVDGMTQLTKERLCNKDATFFRVVNDMLRENSTTVNQYG